MVIIVCVLVFLRCLLGCMLLVWKLQLIVLVSACSAGLVFCLFVLFKWVAVV